MSERFNSGLGGYTCDTCKTLLWSGRDGATNPDNRQMVYKASREDIKKDNLFFCNDNCRKSYCK